MKKVLLNYKSFLGDTFVMRGVSGTLAKRGERSIFLSDSNYPDYKEFFETPNFQIVYNKELPKLFNQTVSHKHVQLNKELITEDSFQYSYIVNPDYITMLDSLIEKNMPLFLGLDKIYTMHFQFENMYLGYYLKKHYDIPNFGYRMLAEGKGVYHLTKHLLWNRYGTLALFANLLGKPLKFEDFTFREGSKGTEKTVLLLTSSRRPDALNNQYWLLARRFFHAKGYKLTIGEFGKTYHSFEQLVELIDQHELIMANDSFPYHLAWSMKKPIILLEKSGFNSEWKHTPYFRNSAKVFSIPSSPMYEEEFLHYLKEGFQCLQH